MNLTRILYLFNIFSAATSKTGLIKSGRNRGLSAKSMSDRLTGQALLSTPYKQGINDVFQY